jgi:type II secretory pathway pseudopilin PulG
MILPRRRPSRAGAQPARPGRDGSTRAAGRGTSGGFTYVALLAAIVIIGITLSATGKYWSNVMRREKEDELLFRGLQYRTAIERYYVARAPHMLPNSVDDLLKDGRFPQARRHLRQAYTDPITGGEFEIIRDKAQGNRIVGVNSASELSPLKQSDFPEGLEDFDNKNSYKEWKFVFAPPQAQQSQQAQQLQQAQQPPPPQERTGRNVTGIGNIPGQHP